MSRRLFVRVNSRVVCEDRDEGIHERGTVVATTLSGGIKVLWDDGHESWTHDRSETLSLLPAWSQPNCPSCDGDGRNVVNCGEHNEREEDCGRCATAYAENAERDSYTDYLDELIKLADNPPPMHDEARESAIGLAQEELHMAIKTLRGAL